MRSVDNIMEKICHHAAQAIRRYVEISGMTPGDMPESFLGAYVFDKIGSEVTMTLETNTTKLFDWNNASKGRRRASDAVKVELQNAVTSVDQSGRIDLVLFDGASQNKEHEEFLALVEFKRWHLSREDRDKLLVVLKYIDTCPTGAICSILDLGGDRSWVEHEQSDAVRMGDRWIECKVGELPHGIPGNYSVCARIFSSAIAPSLKVA